MKGKSATTQQKERKAPITPVIRGSAIEGKGVFTMVPLRKGAKAFRFSDTKRKIKHKAGCHCAICKRCIQISATRWLYPARGSFGWNLNHSCQPSCGIRGKDIVAMRTIKRGEELTIDYATTNTDTAWRMRCRCARPQCRTVIRSVQYLSRRLFSKYENFMPPYVRKGFLTAQRKSGSS